MPLKLLSASPSPYARKVRIALQEKGIPFELVTEVPWDRTTQTPLYNPLEKLPVLIISGDGDSQLASNHVSDAPMITAGPNETAVYESHYILEWLETNYPPPTYWTMLPTSVQGRLQAKQVEVVADGMCDALVLRFFEVQRDREKQSDEWISRQMRKVDGGCRWLDAQLARGQGAFMVDDTFGLADIAAGSVLGYLTVRFKEYPWNERYPRLEKYMNGLMERQSFKDTVPFPQRIKGKVV